MAGMELQMAINGDVAQVRRLIDNTHQHPPTDTNCELLGQGA
jgi:hypothetical protein